MPKQSQLSPKQKKFFNRYIKHGNAERAAIEAGYSLSTARKNAALWTGKNRKKSRSKLLWDAIKAYRDELEVEHDITKENVIKKYKQLINCDVRNFFSPDGTLKQIHELDEDTAYAVEDFNVSTKNRPSDNESGKVTETVTKIRLVNKKAALDSLCKIMGMFVEPRSVGFTTETLDAIFKALPEDYAKEVHRALGELVPKKREAS
jgi:phage terminase small subunit